MASLQESLIKIPTTDPSFSIVDAGNKEPLISSEFAWKSCAQHTVDKCVIKANKNAAVPFYSLLYNYISDK